MDALFASPEAASRNFPRDDEVDSAPKTMRSSDSPNVEWLLREGSPSVNSLTRIAQRAAEGAHRSPFGGSIDVLPEAREMSESMNRAVGELADLVSYYRDLSQHYKDRAEAAEEQAELERADRLAIEYELACAQGLLEETDSMRLRELGQDIIDESVRRARGHSQQAMSSFEAETQTEEMITKTVSPTCTPHHHYVFFHPRMSWLGIVVGLAKITFRLLWIIFARSTIGRGCIALWEWALVLWNALHAALTWS
jgi:hypothetical protein